MWRVRRLNRVDAWLKFKVNFLLCVYPCENLCNVGWGRQTPYLFLYRAFKYELLLCWGAAIISPKRPRNLNLPLCVEMHSNATYL